MQKETKEYKVWMDVLNICACICVVALHINGDFWDFNISKRWLVTIPIETAAYWAVPVFFMLSGANLIDYRERYDTKTYIKLRIKKVLIPYLIWTTIGIFYHSKINHIGTQAIDIVNYFLNGSISPYWFFIPLFSIYLSIPFLGLIKKEERKKVFSLLAVISFVTVCIIPFICTITGAMFNDYIKIPIASEYIIYVLFGYLLTNELSLDKKQRMIIYILGFLGLMARAIPLTLISIHEGSMFTGCNGYLTPITVIYSVAIFVFFQYEIAGSRIIKKIDKRIIRSISDSNFGVYLIHRYIIILIESLLNMDSKYVYFLWRYLFPVPIYILCCIIIYLLRKSKFTKWILY